LKIATAFIPLAAIAFIALVTMRADVRHLEQAVETKASRETVEAQFSAILRELQQINARLDRPGRRP
jgi:hypothetical protein